MNLTILTHSHHIVHLKSASSFPYSQSNTLEWIQFVTVQSVLHISIVDANWSMTAMHAEYDCNACSKKSSWVDNFSFLNWTKAYNQLPKHSYSSTTRAALSTLSFVFQYTEHFVRKMQSHKSTIPRNVFAMCFCCYNKNKIVGSYFFSVIAKFPISSLNMATSVCTYLMYKTMISIALIPRWWYM